MEWNVPVNEMLRDDITPIGSTLLPPGFRGDAHTTRMVQDSLARQIDALGVQSAASQGLSKVITTAEKLRKTPGHKLYLLKDASADGGKGEVVGMLKVGYKHLFLFDERDTVREVEPLCVLDFFVRPDRQRHGLGRRLFDHMLQDVDMRPEQLAIDGPSTKMEQFLHKNYGVERLVRQNNNFAVSPQFFTKGNVISNSGRATPASAATVGRYAAHKPASAIATVIHGGNNSAIYYPDNSRSSSRVATPDVLGSDEEVAAVSPAAAAPAQAEAAPAQAEAAPAQAEAAAAEAEAEPAPEPSPERPTTLEVHSQKVAAAGAGAAPPLSPGSCSASRRDSQLTERGYFDIKFYHNKLW